MKSDIHKWIVLVASFFTNMIAYGVMLSFGTLFVAMLNTFNEKRSTTAVVGSMFIGLGTSFGFFTGLLITRFGIRPVAFTGAILVPAGFIISFWATSILYLDFSISVISGIGCACIRVTGVIVLGKSFTGPQKTIALSIDSLGTGVSGLIYPQLISYLLGEYSLRGTFLILGGLLFNSLACGIIFSFAEKTTQNNQTCKAEPQPGGIQNNAYEGKCDTTTVSNEEKQTDVSIGNHMVIYPAEDSGLQEHTGEFKRQWDKTIFTENDKPNDASSRDIEAIINPVKGNTWQKQIYVPIEGHEAKIGPTIEKRAQKHPFVSKGICPTTIDQQCDCNYEENTHESIFKEDTTKDLAKEKTGNSKRKGVSIIDTDGESGVQNQTDGSDENHYNLWSVIFITSLIGTSTTIACVSAFLTLYQDILRSKDFTIFQINIAFNCYTVFNFVARLLPIIPAMFPKLNIFLVPFVAALIGGIALLVLMFGMSYPIALIGMSLAGIINGAIISSMKTIVFHIVKPGRQVVGFGLLMSCYGVLSAVAGPMFGLIRDSTNSYDLVMIIMCCIYLSSGVLYLLCIAKTGGMKWCHYPWCFDSRERTESTKL